MNELCVFEMRCDNCLSYNKPFYVHGFSEWKCHSLHL